MLVISGASAKMTCVDFENNETMGIDIADSVEGIYWDDLLMIDCTTDDAVLVAENNSDIVAYSADDDTIKNVYDNGYLTGNGITQKIRPYSARPAFEFTFKDAILVTYFSLELFDFGDFNPQGVTKVNATLIAYDTDGNVIDSDSFVVIPDAGSGTIYDAQNGPVLLEVGATGIASVKLVTNEGNAGTDPNFAIDNICFDTCNESSNEVPEFPTLALPIAAIIGLTFIFQRRNE
ncbi:PEF-CTERM sorting domain-containing protein [Methanolobus sp.]|uniref:PEF-CTERM sorting domain-containing protein n=1 Tax=Methanolobus sp. TaxID=1874737 RepID=UPI00258D90D4|nr:PEF-CTERM sorting domain-containing protein [Methanolobus sp.]